MSIKDIVLLRKSVYLFRYIRNRHSFNSGKGNRIINHGGIRIGSRVQIMGSGNRLIMEKGSRLINSLVRIQGNCCTVTLKAGSYVSGAEIWVEDNHCEVCIGEKSFVGHHSHLACTEDGSTLFIGDNCMISSYVQIRTGDSHFIMDFDGNRIIPAKSVKIGPHCWIGEGSKVLKGVELDGEDIVSTGAVVTKSFGRNIIIGGVPAKVIKENVKWDL